MSDKQIVVPEKMQSIARWAYEAWRATCDSSEQCTNGAVRVAEAVLRWITEHPIVPTDVQVHELNAANPHPLDVAAHDRFIAAEWQRRMFLAPEPEVPEEIKDLLWFISEDKEDYPHNVAILEAFRRGEQKGRAK